MAEPVWEVLPPEDPSRPDAPKAAFGRRERLAVALAVAVVSDLLSLWFAFVPPAQWTLDVATALLLFLMLGRHWALLPALIAEAIPGFAVMPAWVLVVGAIAIWGTVSPRGRR